MLRRKRIAQLERELDQQRWVISLHVERQEILRRLLAESHKQIRELRKQLAGGAQSQGKVYHHD